MPCDNPDNHDEFLELLSHLSTAVEESEALHIAMIGDFNANISPGTHTLFGNELGRFCIEESLTIYLMANCVLQALSPSLVKLTRVCNGWITVCAMQICTQR